VIYITSFFIFAIFNQIWVIIMNCINCNFKSPATKFLSTNEIEELSNNCAHVEFKKNEKIFKESSFSSNIVYLKSGLVKVHILGPRSEQITKITKPLAFLGLPTTFSEKINKYSATALEDSSVCFIDLELFKHFIYNNGVFAYQIITELCKNEIDSFFRCLNRTQKQINGRVADALLFFYNDIYEKKDFIIPLSREEFGNYIDTTRESVSRVLTELQKDGLIKINDKKIKILKEETLKKISEKG